MNNRTKSLRLGPFPRLFLAAAAIATFSAQSNAQSLGSAETFAVLGASTVTNTGASQISGNLGVSPGTAISGFPPGVITNGALHAGDDVATQAHADYATAYNQFAGLASPPANNLSGADLGGMTLTPGVYKFNTSATSAGQLTLDAQGDANARFVIQIGTTLITSGGSSVLLVNGADARNVYFQVGTSATLAAGSSFIGNILAYASITTVSGASVTGRLLALTEAVTLDTNRVTYPGLTAAPTPTPSPSATVSPTPTASPTATASPSPSASPAPSASPTASPAQLLNISTRLNVQTGEKVLIGGFIITGNASKKVILRGIGPSMTGVGAVLANPVLALHGSDGSRIISNDDWKDNQQAQIEESTLAPADDREAAIIATLTPGSYTAIVAGKDESTGVAMVELYDLDAASDSKLANISTRGLVQTGSDVMIGGFIFGNGAASEKVIIRALGPSLNDVGGVLADPTLALYDGDGTLLISNDNWRDDGPQAAAIMATGIPPQNDFESAIVTSVPPGGYTAIVAGKGGVTGIALAEVYHLAGDISLKSERE